MRISLFLYLFLFATSSFAQFDFKSDTKRARNVSFKGDTSSNINYKLDQIIDSAYKLDKNYDFEFRLWKRHLMFNFDNVFILTLKNNSWTVRYFDRNNGLRDETKFTERPVDQSKVNQLWELLVENNVLTLPDESLLQDRMVRYIIDTTNLHAGTIQKTDATDGILYCFELLTPHKKKYYNYGCPNFLLERYGNIKELYNAVLLVLLIQKFLGQAVKVC